MSGDTHPYEALGALVLGALSPAEATQVRGHLAGCADCRAKRDRLALPAELLAAVPEEAWTEAAEPSEGVRHRLITAVRAERARSRRRLRALALASAATAASVVIGFAVWGLGQPNSSAGPGTAAPVVRTTAASWQLSGSNAARGVQGQVDVVPVGWGSKLDVQLEGVQQGLRCRLVVVDQRGHRWGAGSWTVSYGGAFYWSGGVAIADDRIAAVEVVTTDGERLLRLS